MRLVVMRHCEVVTISAVDVAFLMVKERKQNNDGNRNTHHPEARLQKYDQPRLALRPQSNRALHYRSGTTYPQNTRWDRCRAPRAEHRPLSLPRLLGMIL